jgi:hypothetical protein
MVRCALAGSFQKLGSSADLFSSARRRVAVSTSKMPPQQPDRLLDVFNKVLCFGAHRLHSPAKGLHVAAKPRFRNIAGPPVAAVGR